MPPSIAAAGARGKQHVILPVFIGMRRLVPAVPAAALLLASCSLGPGARITVLLPPLPDPWRAAFPRVDCLLVYTDGSGEMRRERVDGWDSGHVIDCSKDGNTPLLAYPILPTDQKDPLQPGALRPAGGVYPASTREYQDGPAIDLTWQDGAAAHVARELVTAGLDTSLFNMTRLSEELRGLPDPWDIDLDTMAQRIASGDFDVYDIDPLPARDIRVAAEEGSWVMESPFRAAVETDPEGVLHLAGVSLGLHAVFSPGRIVKVEVREREVISSPVAPEASPPQGAQDRVLSREPEV